MANVLNSIIWLIILVIVSFFVAGFCAGFYIIIHPFSVCIPALSKTANLLLFGMQLPRYCAEKMMDGSPVTELLEDLAYCEL